MILFTSEHVPMILDGRKTQTRRLGKKRWNVGAIHQCFTQPPWSTGKTEFRPEPFARVLIKSVRHEKLHEISDDDVRAEGYDNRDHYIAALARIHHVEPWETRDYGVWVVEFELADVRERAGEGRDV